MTTDAVSTNGINFPRSRDLIKIYISLEICLFHWKMEEYCIEYFKPSQNRSSNERNNLGLVPKTRIKFIYNDNSN